MRTRASASGFRLPASADGQRRHVHEALMGEALREGELGRGRTHPNPCVGSVVARGGKVIARGHHERAGGPHAEIAALGQAGAKARGADVYVTLEPCNHHGRTPPCTEALIAAGVKRVFFGSADPNPSVRGRGGERLRKAGIVVQGGVLEGACDGFNEQWFKFIQRGLPWVHLKAAITLDGKLATSRGDSKWISGEESRERVHVLRDRLDAVLVGIGTALADDPQLTARLPPEVRGVAPRDPVRVIVDAHGRLPPGARMLQQRSPAPTLVAVTAKASPRRLQALRKAGARVLECKAARGGHVDLQDLLARLAREGLTSVLVEGGAALHGAFLAQRLWDELSLFVAPTLAGKDALTWNGAPGPKAMEDAMRVSLREVLRVGEDTLLRARPL